MCEIIAINWWKSPQGTHVLQKDGKINQCFRYNISFEQHY